MYILRIYFLVGPKSLPKLFGSFWFDKCEIKNACDLNVAFPQA